MKRIVINENVIRLLKINDQEYICLTDMMSAKNGEFFVTDWLRNRNTLEFLGLWESLHNPDFNCGEFAIIKSQSGLNNFKISVKQYIEQTAGIGLLAKPGRYGGTYAHQDIAFEFAMWISPAFKIYLIDAYQKLKREEYQSLEWNARRELAKVNYHIHTAAIQEHLIPLVLNKQQIQTTYASEADLLNVALFGKTALQWREQNPSAEGNMRDYATVNQLICLSNLENINALLIQEGKTQSERLFKLNEMAIHQMRILLRGK